MSHTLFIANLDGKVRKAPLKRLLHTLCAPYGQILDIIVKRVPDHLRGTAFVVFTLDESVNLAIQTLHKQVVLGRPLRVERARVESRAYKEYVMYALGQDLVDTTTDRIEEGLQDAGIMDTSSPQEDMDVE